MEDEKYKDFLQLYANIEGRLAFIRAKKMLISLSCDESRLNRAFKKLEQINKNLEDIKDLACSAMFGTDIKTANKRSAKQ